MNDNDRNVINQPRTAVEMTRRQTLLTLSTILSGGLFATSAYGSFVRHLLGSTGGKTIDKLVSPSSSLILTDREEYLVAYTNGLPDHATGEFPGANGPSPILPIPQVFQIPKRPVINASPTPLNGWLFGVALNGVVFDPSGPYWRQQPRTGWQFEVASRIARVFLGLDSSNAHTQQNGEYHYHGRPIGLQEKLEKLARSRGERLEMCLLGFAADGFPIYAPYAYERPMDPTSPIVPMRSGYEVKSGPRPAGGPGGDHDGTFVQDYVFTKGGDLDECNGRFGVTPEYPQGTYYYCVTDVFPFVPRFWRGTPHASFYHMEPGEVAPVPPGLAALFG